MRTSYNIPTEEEHTDYYIIPGISFSCYVALWDLKLSPVIEYRSEDNKEYLASGYAFKKEDMKTIEDRAKWLKKNRPWI